ncbi:unnamed protein product [Aphanomyces euteiches]
MLVEGPTDHGGIRVNLRRKVQIPTRRRLVDANTTSNEIQFDEVPLGVGVGTHYAEIYLGLPPQKASVIIDTGSHMTALPCASCIDCGEHTDPPYDLTKSTTANYLTCAEYGHCYSCESNQCRVTQSYAEGSMWSALMVSELCWIGSLNEKNAPFYLSHYGIRFPIGCQTKETGLFITQKENGIMGMSQDPSTLVPTLVQAGILKRNLFSLCFADTGGTMVLGGFDPKLHLAPPMYTPLVSSTGWYTVEVLDILIGNTSLGVSPSWYNSGRGVIVDSGSTDTYFSSSIRSSFESLFLKVAGRQYVEEESFELSLAEQRKLPDVQIVLRGSSAGSSVVLTIPPRQYYTTTTEGTLINNIHFSQGSGGGTQFKRSLSHPDCPLLVLGASTMMNFNVIFDVDKRRVGFAPSQCNQDDSNSAGVKISKGQWKDKTFWESYGTIVSIALLCSLIGVGIFGARFVWRQCRKRHWTQLSAEDVTPRNQPSPLAVEDDDSMMHTPASPQRKLSRSPDLHSIQEQEDEG